MTKHISGFRLISVPKSLNEFDQYTNTRLLFWHALLFCSRGPSARRERNCSQPKLDNNVHS